MKEEIKVYYPFSYITHPVFTVAFYGGNDPLIIKGSLILRTYYKDDEKKEVDIKHTSDYYMDEIFYETNKVIRESMNDSYSGKRELIELSLPELGNEYRIIYNSAEVPSERYDDQLAILANRDNDAHGVAIILKRTPSNGIQYLKETEARQIAQFYTNE